MIHELKTQQPYFEETWNQNKKFEHRYNDREFKINDILVLKEYNLKKDSYSGRQVIVRITYIMEVPHRETYVILSITTIDFITPKS